jgi:hypothetical protein
MKAKNRREFFHTAARVIQVAFRAHRVRRAAAARPCTAPLTARPQVVRNPVSSAGLVQMARMRVTRACAVFREARRNMISESHNMFEQLSHLNVPSKLAMAAQSASPVRARVWRLTRRPQRPRRSRRSWPTSRRACAAPRGPRSTRRQQAPACPCGRPRAS